MDNIFMYEETGTTADGDFICSLFFFHGDLEQVEIMTENSACIEFILRDDYADVTVSYRNAFETKEVGPTRRDEFKAYAPFISELLKKLFDDVNDYMKGEANGR